MNKYKAVLILMIFPVLFFGIDRKKDFVIATAAGYKKVMDKVYETYKKETGKSITAVFGNMQQIQTQAKESGLIKIVIGDRRFLNNGKSLNFSYYTDLGTGKLVLAYPKGVEIKKISDLQIENIKKIGLPNTKNAIYGIAALEYMKSINIYDNLENKLIQVDTVPQVTSYIVTKEIDAGFINLTNALAMKDSIGGYILINDGYTPIIISAGIVSGYEKDIDVINFMEFLKSSKALAIINTYGL